MSKKSIPIPEAELTELSAALAAAEARYEKLYKLSQAQGEYIASLTQQRNDLSRELQAIQTGNEAQ
jgi:prefoldin subunit 5